MWVGVASGQRDKAPRQPFGGAPQEQGRSPRDRGTPLPFPSHVYRLQTARDPPPGARAPPASARAGLSHRSQCYGVRRALLPARAYQGISRSVLDRRHLGRLHFLLRLLNLGDRAAGGFHLGLAPPLWGMEGGPSTQLPGRGCFPAASPHLCGLGYPGPMQVRRWRGAEEVALAMLSDSAPRSASSPPTILTPT